MKNGLSVEKQAASKLMTITLLSSDPKFDEIYLSNYATLNVLDMLRRVPGVGSVSNVVTMPCAYGCNPTNWPTWGLR